MTTIRPATVDDAEALVRLRWQFRIEAGTSASLSREGFEEHMTAFARDAFEPEGPWWAWVAEEGDRRIGCVWLQLIELIPHPGRGRGERPIAYVSSMYVEPDRRNDGLGRALLEAALAGFGRTGGPLWLELEGD